MPTERVRFPGAFGDSLAARLELPSEGDPRAYTLFAHCFTCSKDLKAIRRISRTLAERGIAVLRFDFTGLGESEGDFAGTDFSSNLDDLEAAAAFLRSRYAAPALLVGHTFGGTAVLVVVRRVAEARAIVTLGAPSTTDHLRGVLLRAAPELPDVEKATAEIAGRRFRVRRALRDDLAAANVEAAVRTLPAPLLVLHAQGDEVVSIDDAERIFAAAPQPKAFVAVSGADHLLLHDPADADYVGRLIAVWAERHLA